MSSPEVSWSKTLLSVVAVAVTPVLAEIRFNFATASETSELLIVKLLVEYPFIFTV